MIDDSYSMCIKELAYVFETMEYKYGAEIFISALGMTIPMLAEACDNPAKAMKQLQELIQKNHRKMQRECHSQ